MSPVRPAARVVLGLAGMLVAGLLGGPTTSSAAAVTVGPATVAVAAEVPGAGDDFARLPERCYRPGLEYSIISPCAVVRRANRPVMVGWGDSHMLMYLPALRRLARLQDVNLVMLISPGCPVSLPFPESAGERRLTCDGKNEQHLAFLKGLARSRVPAQVLVASYWSGYRATYAKMAQGQEFDDYVEHIARLAVERSGPMMQAVARTALPVAFVTQAAIVAPDAPPCPLGEEPYQCDQLRSAALPDEEANRRFVTQHLAGPIGRATVVEPSQLYCDALVCRARLGSVGTFWDDVHLSGSLAQRAKPWFARTFERLAARQRAS